MRKQRVKAVRSQLSLNIIFAICRPILYCQDSSNYVALQVYFGILSLHFAVTLDLYNVRFPWKKTIFVGYVKHIFFFIFCAFVFLVPFLVT